MSAVARAAPSAIRACRAAVVAAVGAVLLGGMATTAFACKPLRPRPPVNLTSMGPCGFDPDAFGFVGEPSEQAACLLRPGGTHRHPRQELIPASLASRVGQSSGLPDRDALAAHLAALDLVWDHAPFLWSPLSRARDNDADAPLARYLVLHDTSTPNYGRRPFPDNIDAHTGINNLARYRCADGWGPGHVVINRGGLMLVTHELGQPWRATKFERANRFGLDLKGLFLHVELVQPRRSAPGRGRRNDAMAPTPGFSDAQYERLALIYAIASVRAGRWLIPAFHSAIDADIRGGHDDPRNFDVAVFAAAIDHLMLRLERYVGVVAELEEPESHLAGQAHPVP